jgi:ABC-2 type transport system permease protein
MTTTDVTAAAVERPAPGVPALRTTFAALLVRDLHVIRRELPSFAIRTAMQPLFFVFVFAYVMPKIGTGAGGPMAAATPGGVTFSTILVPGMVAMALTIQGMMAVTMPLVAELGWTKEIEDRVLAPVPLWMIGAQKIVSGALQGLLAAAVTFPIVFLVHAEGQQPAVDVANWPLFLFVLVTATLLMAGFGLLLGTFVNPTKIQMVFAVVLIPVTFLGCVYYPWAQLDAIPWLKWLVLLNPVVYVSEGLRAALTPQLGHMPVWAVALALAGGTVVVGWLALRTFTRRVQG